MHLLDRFALLLEVASSKFFGKLDELYDRGGGSLIPPMIRGITVGGCVAAIAAHLIH